MPSLPDSGLSIRELDALFDQSPIPMVFGDRELRARRTNAAFRQLVGLPDEALIGRRPSESDAGVDTALTAGATCLYAAYDPASRRCQLTSAGHLPPGLRRPGGAVEFLDVPPPQHHSARRNLTLPGRPWR